VGRATREASLELFKRRSVVSYSLYRQQTSRIAGEKVPATVVLVGGRQRLTDLRVNGDANDMDAFAQQIEESLGTRR